MNLRSSLIVVAVLVISFSTAGCVAGTGSGGGVAPTGAASSGGASSGGTSSKSGASSSSSGASSSSGSSSGGLSKSLSKAVIAFVEADCQKAFECCSAADLAKKFGSAVPVDAAKCTDEQSKILLGFAAFLQDSINKGRVSVDSAKADTCVAAMKAVPCKDYSKVAKSGSMGACEGVFVPHVEAGGVCVSDTECKSTYCDGALNKAGKCKTAPKEGDACTASCGDLSCVNGKCADIGKPSTTKICGGK